MLIDRGLCHEVVAVFKVFDFVELRFHEIVDCLDIGLHAMCSRIDRVVVLSW